MEEIKYSKLAIAGFILGILSLLGSLTIFFVLGVILLLFATLGLLFSIIGIKSTKNKTMKGRTLSVIGLITSILTILISATYLIAFLRAFNNA